MPWCAFHHHFVCFHFFVSFWNFFQWYHHLIKCLIFWVILLHSSFNRISSGSSICTSKYDKMTYSEYFLCIMVTWLSPSDTDRSLSATFHLCQFTNTWHTEHTSLVPSLTTKGPWFSFQYFINAPQDTKKFVLTGSFSGSLTQITSKFLMFAILASTQAHNRAIDMHLLWRYIELVIIVLVQCHLSCDLLKTMKCSFISQFSESLKTITCIATHQWFWCCIVFVHFSMNWNKSWYVSYVAPQCLLPIPHVEKIADVHIVACSNGPTMLLSCSFQS